MSRFEQCLLIAVIVALHQFFLIPSKVIQKDARCRCRNLKRYESQLRRKLVSFCLRE